MSNRDKWAIWKYTVPTNADEPIGMPDGARIVSAGIDPQNQICVWALCNVEDTQRFERRDIRVFGTGEKMPREIAERLQHIATIRDGSFMWHVVEILREKPGGSGA